MARRNSKIVLGFESHPDFSDNSRALYDYFKEKGDSKYEYVWLLTDKNNRSLHSDLKSIHFEDDNFDEEFSKVDIIFSTHFYYGERKKKYQTWVCLWHGGGYKKVGKFSEGDLFPYINSVANKIDYFLSTSQFMSAIFSCELALKYEKFLEFGSPRVDLLTSKKSKSNLSTVLGIDAKKYDKIIFNLPTFKNGAGRVEGHLNTYNSLGCLPYNEEDLNKYLRKNNYLLITKLHPSEQGVIDIKDYSNIKVITNQDLIKYDIDLHNILGSADLLVTDYSSIAKDYLTLDRPVLYVHADFDDYNTDRGIVFGDYELWFPGPRVSTIDEFIKESKKLLAEKDYFQKERERTNRVSNGAYRFDSRERLFDFVENKIHKNLLGANRRVEKLHNENERLKRQYEDLLSKHNTIVADNKMLSERLQTIENSRSWKITKPVRGTASVIRRVRKSI